MAAQFLLPQSVSISCAALSSVPFDRPTELECESPPRPPLFAAGHFVTADFPVLVGDSGCAEDRQHRAFTRKFLKRRRSRQDNEDMKAALAEHTALLRTTFYNLEREGDEEICTACGTKIYGCLCCNGLEEFMHWGCARDIATRWERHDPFVLDLPARRDGAAQRRLRLNNDVGSHLNCCHLRGT